MDRGGIQQFSQERKRGRMDVAGGHGHFFCEALKRHPQMKGILLDLPSVIEGA